MTDPEKNRFSKIAQNSDEQSLVVELIDFLKSNKKWWLAPILVVLLSLGLLLLLSGTAAAPFIYTLF
jgi:hypothetical protein